MIGMLLHHLSHCFLHFCGIGGFYNLEFSVSCVHICSYTGVCLRTFTGPAGLLGVLLGFLGGLALFGGLPKGQGSVKLVNAGLITP